ncbi:leucine-rich repeat-containing protein 71-like isoform X4 [Mytilus californianus]|uniref:leucine-rich repeat-containing protein 71-like isoform X4 n=1 Tax=Mytilus californianus TaxID=6549 RepID=UPI002246E7A8|nr:leucine-rich repeat-containing protein 71-like isoform X4 [Mytilus californianus]
MKGMANAKLSFQSVANKIKMGKKLEKGLKEKNASAVSQDEENPNKTPEPYSCTGNFQADFTELCRRNSMTYIPPIIPRARPPTVMGHTESGKPDKGKGKAPQAPVEPDPDPEQDLDGEGVEAPPKTFTMKDKFEYFRPSVQVEMENFDKPDTVTEIYIRGWKIVEPIMEIFKQCWPKMAKLHTINLWNCGLSGEVITILASTITEIPEMRNLVLDGNTVVEENWHELMGEESPIQNLSLRHCGITDKGAEQIGQALGSTKRCNTKLISLNLSGNRITDVGAEHLALGLRMNRNLMSLSLASNFIGDKGASKIAEILSRFPLTHEEVVERRKHFSEKDFPERNKSPPGSRRDGSKDRPASVRSQSHMDKDKKGSKASAKKKDPKGKDAKEEEKHDKTKKKEKEDKTLTKKGDKSGTVGGRSSGVFNINRPLIMASIAADTKGNKGKGKGKDKTKQAAQEVEDLSGGEVVNPLTDVADFIDGQLWVSGNRVLINLNLSRNKIAESGMNNLLKAMQYQTTILMDNKSGGTGLMRIALLKNKISPEHDVMRKLNDIMLHKDPYYKQPPQTPDGQSTT